MKSVQPLRTGLYLSLDFSWATDFSSKQHVFVFESLFIFYFHSELRLSALFLYVFGYELYTSILGFSPQRPQCGCCTRKVCCCQSQRMSFSLSLGFCYSLLLVMKLVSRFSLGSSLFSQSVAIVWTVRHSGTAQTNHTLFSAVFQFQHFLLFCFWFLYFF